jgi:RimJ/RimL family protein N-acetyltransferase
MSASCEALTSSSATSPVPTLTVISGASPISPVAFSTNCWTPARSELLTEMSGNYLRQWRDLRLGPFAAIDKATGAWIGQIGLNHLAYWPGPEKVEVGWELHRRWWGRGLATEGGLAALRFGFGERGLRRIISTAAPDNHASRHVMEKIGLTYRGTHVISGAEIVWYAIDRTG